MVSGSMYAQTFRCIRDQSKWEGLVAARTAASLSDKLGYGIGSWLLCSEESFETPVESFDHFTDLGADAGLRRSYQFGRIAENQGFGSKDVKGLKEGGREEGRTRRKVAQTGKCAVVESIVLFRVEALGRVFQEMAC